jgi:hypothetical protein
MVDFPAPMPEGFRQNLVIARNRQPLEDVILSVLQRVRGWFNRHIARRTLKAREHNYFVWRETSPLSASHFFGRDLGQFIGACFPNQNGDFIVCGLTPVLCDEGPDGSISLLTPLTESIEQFTRYAANLKATVLALRVSPILNLITQRSNLKRQRTPVDFREVSPAFVNAGCLKRLPPPFSTVIGQIRGDGVGMKLWIEFPAGVVMVDGDCQIACDSIRVRAIHSDTRRSVPFKLLKRFANCPLVRLNQPRIAAHNCHNGNRFRR